MQSIRPHVNVICTWSNALATSQLAIECYYKGNQCFCQPVWLIITSLPNSFTCTWLLIGNFQPPLPHSIACVPARAVHGSQIIMCFSVPVLCWRLITQQWTMGSQVLMMSSDNFYANTWQGTHSVTVRGGDAWWMTVFSMRMICLSREFPNIPQTVGLFLA